MLKNDKFSVIAVSFYLFVYGVLLQFESTLSYAMAMLLFSPVLLIWMIFSILKYGKYSGKSLDQEEFGYQDRDTTGL